MSWPQYFCDTRRHLVCVPFSIHDLHEMADNLNIKRCWYHRSRKTGLSHYDIPKRRKLEIMRKCHVVPSALIVLIARGMLNDMYFDNCR